MRKTLLIALAIVGISGLIGNFVLGTRLLRNPGSGEQSESANVEQQSQPQSQQAETVTVTYDDNGFSPSEITIAKGSTVNFVNKSQIPLWVASNPHPEHTDYPEFDTMRNRDNYPGMGENYSFTFDKAGTWKYHSHTASGDGTDTGVHPGVITVK